LLEEKWPTADPGVLSEQEFLRTGIEPFDSLFPGGGIPPGQWLEICGPRVAGKTRLLFAFLRALTADHRIVYLDFPRSFFPAAALAAGVDVAQLWVARPADLRAGITLAEKLLADGWVSAVVFDLVGARESLPHILAHRLRQHTLRARAWVLFLTTGPSSIGSSLVSLRLEVERRVHGGLNIHLLHSRISRAGVRISWQPETEVSHA
jgi:hypothetical protein